MLIQTFHTLALQMMVLAAAGTNDMDTMADRETSTYRVTRITTAPVIDSIWDKPPWQSLPALHLKHRMWITPVFTPDVRAKLAYDDDALYIIFKVDDQFVKAVVDTYNGPVSRDSCVEFFFTPGDDPSEGYFNLEINCGGTALFAHQQRRHVERINIPAEDFKRVELAHSMPRIIDPEITTPVTWTLEVRLPLDLLAQYAQVSKPAAGVEWRANFYKIATDTSNRHYLAWSFVDNPTPQFHMPEYFGTLRFE